MDNSLLVRGKNPNPEGGGGLPYEEHMGVCQELGSYFQEKDPKKYVNFSQNFGKGYNI